MTGFLFGLGMVIALAQLPSLLGVEPGEGNFFPALWDVLGELGRRSTARRSRSARARSRC